MDAGSSFSILTHSTLKNAILKKQYFSSLQPQDIGISFKALSFYQILFPRKDPLFESFSIINWQEDERGMEPDGPFGGHAGQK
jgi:hypothetical protein